MQNLSRCGVFFGEKKKKLQAFSVQSSSLHQKESSIPVLFYKDLDVIKGRVKQTLWHIMVKVENWYKAFFRAGNDHYNAGWCTFRTQAHTGVHWTLLTHTLSLVRTQVYLTVYLTRASCSSLCKKDGLKDDICLFTKGSVITLEKGLLYGQTTICLLRFAPQKSWLQKVLWVITKRHACWNFERANTYKDDWIVLTRTPRLMEVRLHSRHTAGQMLPGWWPDSLLLLFLFLVNCKPTQSIKPSTGSDRKFVRQQFYLWQSRQAVERGPSVHRTKQSCQVHKHK